LRRPRAETRQSRRSERVGGTKPSVGVKGLDGFVIRKIATDDTGVSGITSLAAGRLLARLSAGGGVKGPDGRSGTGTHAWRRTSGTWIEGLSDGLRERLGGEQQRPKRDPGAKCRVNEESEFAWSAQSRGDCETLKCSISARTLLPVESGGAGVPLCDPSISNLPDALFGVPV
jgi:hypothetical protein